MSLRSDLDISNRADEWCETSDERAAAEARSRDPLEAEIGRLECDADAGRITWAECRRRSQALTRPALSALSPQDAEIARIVDAANSATFSRADRALPELLATGDMATFAARVAGFRAAPVGLPQREIAA